MQIGSLVKLIDDKNWVNKVAYKVNGHNVTFPDKTVIYTIRGFCLFTGGVLLIEIINPEIYHGPVLTEPSFRISRFVEIQSPMTIYISELQHQAEKV